MIDYIEDFLFLDDRFDGFFGLVKWGGMFWFGKMLYFMRNGRIFF